MKRKSSGTPKPPRQEFERKFLVKVRLLPEPQPPCKETCQGYLQLEPLQIRVRIVNDDRAVLEIKGPDNFESSSLELPLRQARYLLQRHLAEGSMTVEKCRHYYPGPHGLQWEVDIFEGRNAGLVVAEIELPSPQYKLPKRLPPWVGREVTDDPRFKNKNLARRPFKSWPKRERQAVLDESRRH